jgi:regulator of RNase E activity RraA
MDDPLLTLLRADDTHGLHRDRGGQRPAGFARFTRGTVPASHLGGALMMGSTRTARIAAASPPTEPPAAIGTRRLAYYRSMAEAQEPAVAVIEDADWPDCVGADWGEVNATFHKALGLAGAQNNGVMPDLGDLPEGFPLVAGSIGPSHGFGHVQAIELPVTVFGLTVALGGLVHVDRHGAFVIPPEVVPDRAAALATLRASERVVLEPARAGFPDVTNFEAVWSRLETSRT